MFIGHAGLFHAVFPRRRAFRIEIQVMPSGVATMGTYQVR